MKSRHFYNNALQLQYNIWQFRSDCKRSLEIVAKFRPGKIKKQKTTIKIKSTTLRLRKVRTYILRRPQNFGKSPPYFWLQYNVHTDKSKVKISQNFVAFSEYMNFITLNCKQETIALLANITEHSKTKPRFCMYLSYI